MASLLAVALVVSGGALFTQRFVANQAEAADSANVNWLVTDQRFDCNSFYTTGNSADAGGNYGVFRWPVNADGTLGTGVNVYKGSGTGGGWRSDQIATMAIGPDFVTDSNSPWYSSWSYGAQEKKIVAYHWSWGSGGTSTNPDKRDWIPVQKVTPGENKTREVLVPNPTVATGRSAGSNWSGGEVNQLTGEIYFTGSNSDAVRNDGQGTAALMRYNPVTEQYIAPSRLVPASEHDKLSREKDGKGALAPGDYSFTVSSDVAVDADGNFYIVVHSEYWGTRVRYLLKVTAGAHQTDWKWNKIGVLTGDVPDGAWWGMGFVNGTLYVGGTGAGRERIYRVDTMSGQVSRLNSSNAPWSIYDGAACQVAPLVTGKVYNDVNGNGQIDPGEDALPGQTVEIYDKNGVLRGTELTDGEGSYDFLVNSAGKTDSDFYVRVARPQIDGVNSAQTYASAGDDNGNITTAYCWDHGQDYYESHVSGICRGAREDQRDRLAESTVGTANSPVGANGAMIVSKIHFGNDKSVAHADFGITNAASYGDAAYDTEVFPSGPGTSYQGPSHIRGSVHGPLLYLGSKAEANQPVVGSSVGVGGADLHGVSDDGVDLEVSPGVFVSLQDQV
ncbi:MAG: hypothetical protein LBG70_00135, partial [Bifidobacteriaceae bacterium]|nr:hypothetical protein [Bifidobacteriaceae bacterium]